MLDNFILKSVLVETLLCEVLGCLQKQNGLRICRKNCNNDPIKSVYAYSIVIDYLESRYTESSYFSLTFMKIG